MSRTWIRPMVCALVFSLGVVAASPARADEREIRRILAQLEEAYAKLADVDARIESVTATLTAIKEKIRWLEEMYIETGKEEYKLELHQQLEQYTYYVSVMRSLRVERKEILDLIEQLEARLRRLQGRP